MVFQAPTEVSATSIPLDVNETTVVHLTASNPIQPTGQRALDRWFAHDTAVTAEDKPVPFQVKVEYLERIQQAKLVVGLHRRGGIEGPLRTTLNGNHIEIDTGDAHEFTEFFAPVDAEVPVKLLRGHNEILITTQPGTTITSVHLATQRTLD